jgi:FKBP-type peptidyl-prolyl cis-trans isomerase SlyD
MKIEKNKVVSLTYTLRYDSAKGEIVQEVKEDKPFVHLFGVGSLLPAFEENLKDLEKGGKFAFHLPFKEAYGEIREDDVVKLSKDIFIKDGKLDTELLQIGRLIPMQNDDGHVIEGKILSIEEDGVVMDFNHPLAGKDLHFSGEILEVRNASEEEISHGHVHGAGGHQH